MNDRRFQPGRHSKLTSEERRRIWDPPQFLQRFGVRPGQDLLDLGCGPGFWTLPLADITGGSGRVHAVDVSPEMLERLAEQNPPDHVILLEGAATLIPIEADSVDFAWLAFVFHEIEPPEECVAELARVLRPAAKLAILDWDPDATGGSGPPTSHRIPSSQVIEWLNLVGFTQTSQTWHDENTYLIEALASQSGG